ncbi:MAG TPA: patatin [Gammaproteobacteria bacterium]|nr:patatin [Pseudomonadales bacterium]MEC8812717.1 patatin-like phospholipase family protein [Pseudomonadota bacterium]HAG96485.1 patatin [Gammaproteobacteria bacterium]HAU16264.1 patatin [Gammaproteobacteria bacterium]HBO93064.1 patatin [Gammaproteobacteria bacterium]
MSAAHPSAPHPMTALVLTAGGARGAYQAGVMKRISEIPAFVDQAAPFSIITGASAGAINGAAIASQHDNFGVASKLLVKLWASLEANNVYRSDAFAMMKNAASLALDFGLGGLVGAGRVKSLVDSSPLYAFLNQNLKLDGIRRAVKEGGLYALGITATGYHTGRAFTFVEGKPGHPLWSKSRRVALPAEITLPHVLASAAIPIVFPPVELPAGAASAFFGDGAMRLVTPLSPAIRLGADRLLAVGVRCQESANSLLRSEWSQDADFAPNLKRPPLSQICGTLMNAIFLDHLDSDLDHLKRMNSFVAEHEKLASLVDLVAESDSDHEPMRIVTPLVISPSADIAIIAKTLQHRMPKTIRYVMDGLGTPDAQSADLTSFLLFDSEFTRELIQLGYRDAAQRIDEIEAFLRDPDYATAPTLTEVATE